MTSEAITNRLCKVRTDYGITQKKLSSVTNISTRTIMRIENGKQVFDYSHDNKTI